jgi:hypothetical protein
VERQLKADNDRKLQEAIRLQNEIAQLEKQNERNNNEIVTRFETQIKDVKRKGDEKITDNEVKLSELQENRNIMDETYKKRVQFEAELFHWRTQCENLKKVIQQEKYNNQIELAKKKQKMEIDSEAKLELIK